MRATATALVVLVTAAAGIAAGAPDAGAGRHKKGPQTEWRYPVKGDHSYGNLANNGFGVKRPDGSVHAGQDVIADCGQPLIAAHRATVRARGSSAGTGYYVVLDGGDTKFDFVYDHMKGPGGPGKRHSVKAGRRIGYVGRTGTASGVCHLHFELWKGAWFDGGHRVNPLKHLRRWDKWSKGEEVDENELGQ